MVNKFCIGLNVISMTNSLYCKQVNGKAILLEFENQKGKGIYNRLPCIEGSELYKIYIILNCLMNCLT